MTFTNSILAGTTLVRESISSEGFVSGSTGWEIQRDGDAEFNGATFRGTVEVTGTGNNRVRIIVQSGIPTLEFRNSDGELFYVDIDDDAFRMQWASAGNSGLFFARDEGGNHGIVLRSSETGAPSVIFNDDNGFLYTGSYSPLTYNTWQNVTVNSGTAVAGNEPQVKLLPDGTCIMRGVVTGHSTVVNTTILTLPVGRRPARSGRYACSAEGTDDTHHMFVNTSGAISVARVGSGGSSGDNDTWFNNIFFSTV